MALSSGLRFVDLFVRAEPPAAAAGTAPCGSRDGSELAAWTRTTVTAMETEEPWSYRLPYDIDMAQFLRDGFVILREA